MARFIMLLFTLGALLSAQTFSTSSVSSGKVEGVVIDNLNTGNSSVIITTTDNGQKAYRITVAGEPSEISLPQGETFGGILTESRNRVSKDGIVVFNSTKSNGGVYTLKGNTIEPILTPEREYPLWENGIVLMEKIRWVGIGTPTPRGIVATISNTRQEYFLVMITGTQVLVIARTPYVDQLGTGIWEDPAGNLQTVTVDWARKGMNLSNFTSGRFQSVFSIDRFTTLRNEATGERYNLSRGEIRKTGDFTLEPYKVPSDAKIASTISINFAPAIQDENLVDLVSGQTLYTPAFDEIVLSPSTFGCLVSAPIARRGDHKFKHLVMIRKMTCN